MTLYITTQTGKDKKHGVYSGIHQYSSGLAFTHPAFTFVVVGSNPAPSACGYYLWSVMMGRSC